MLETGAEWIVDAAGCSPRALATVDTMRDLFDRIIRELDLHPLHIPSWHIFPPPGGGITGFVMLSESHLACHTYPEHGALALNLYCCRPRPEWPWRERLAELVGATRVDVRVCERAAGVTEMVQWP